MKSTLTSWVGDKTSPKIIILTLLLSGFLGISTLAQDKIIDAFKQSYALEKSENYKGAIASLKEVYQADAYEINLRLGWLTYLAGQIPESLDYYSKAVSLKPYAIEPKLGLVLPLSVQGKWNEIEEIYQKILQIDPQNTLVNYRLGLIYYNRGNFEKADPYLEKVVNLFPFDYDGLILLAWNKLNLQKTRESKVLFQKVLMNNPDDASALEGLKLIK
ncbi:tetratricopeptide repeat protein [Shivajiella indica]|uniref:Tetratricopeptide repeat protein n=1 Tax=Shivajiella indica TaxID=872115 RepID=A0ABW5B3S2_9BACT